MRVAVGGAGVLVAARVGVDVVDGLAVAGTAVDVAGTDVGVPGGGVVVAVTGPGVAVTTMITGFGVATAVAGPGAVCWPAAREGWAAS